MESPEKKLIVLAATPNLYDFLKGSQVASDYAIFYHGKDGNPESFIRENVIRTIILEADEAPEADFGLIDRVRKTDPLLNIVVISPPGPPDELLDWIRRGAADVIARPADVEAIRASLAKIVEKNDLRRETFQLEKRLEKKYVFQGIVSKNPVMFEVFTTIEQISRFFSSVLITGETGTGKEMIARAIHALSGVRNRRLVVCDCASIPENLFESELFGYVRGAFTGADRTKRGLFEEAHEGVIFLDEIGEIPLPVQAKLLRVLENRQFRPLGSNEVKSIDVRVIAATNRDLAAFVRSGGLPRGPHPPPQPRRDPYPSPPRAERGHPAPHPHLPRSDQPVVRQGPERRVARGPEALPEIRLAGERPRARERPAERGHDRTEGFPRRGRHAQERPRGRPVAARDSLRPPGRSLRRSRTSSGNTSPSS